jgi:hypothetical protein
VYDDEEDKLSEMMMNGNIDFDQFDMKTKEQYYIRYAGDEIEL